MKAHVLTPTFVETIPSTLDDGTLYVSMQYATASHLCACGCRVRVVTPLGPDDWTMTFDGTVSLDHSVGNGQQSCRSHYLLTNNRVVWLAKISKAATSAALVRDLRAHQEPEPVAPAGIWARLRHAVRRRH